MNFLNDQKGYKLHEVGQRTYLVTPINIEPQRFGLEESFIVLLSLQKPKQTSPICFAPETTNDHTKQIAGL